MVNVDMVFLSAFVGFVGCCVICVFGVRTSSRRRSRIQDANNYVVIVTHFSPFKFRVCSEAFCRDRRVILLAYFSIACSPVVVVVVVVVAADTIHITIYSCLLLGLLLQKI
jgi:hypothetical protein